MVDFLTRIDEDIFLVLHHLMRGDVADSFMWLVSAKFVWIPMYVAILVWLYRSLGWKKTVITAICIGLAVFCADGLCADIIRPWFERLRPSHPDNPVSENIFIINDYRGGSYGFPSCHAANTFMLATFVSLIAKGWRVVVWMYFWALLNCLSRIYLGVHYPGDLLFGALIGATVGWLSYLLARVAVVKIVREPLNKIKDRCCLNPVTATGLVTIILLLLFSAL